MLDSKWRKEKGIQANGLKIEQKVLWWGLIQAITELSVSLLLLDSSKTGLFTSVHHTNYFSKRDVCPEYSARHR